VDCDRSLVRTRSNTAFSIYHSLQQQIRVQNFHGLTASFSHTWSRAIDNVSEIFSTVAGGNTNAFAANPFDTNFGERGLSGNSFPHLISVFYLYDLPFYKNQQGIVGKILGGWQWNGTWNYSTGQAWTPIQTVGSNRWCDATFDTQFIGLGSCRPFVGNLAASPDMVGQCTDHTLADCGLVDFFTGAPVNPDAVSIIYNDDESAQFFGTPFGNFPRNRFQGQSFNQWNMGLFKNTKVTEKVNFQLQANVTNIFNRQFRGTPDPVIEDGNFASGGSFGNNFFSVATPTPARTRRRMELGLKIIF
jgi:hypothetical protein